MRVPRSPAGQDAAVSCLGANAAPDAEPRRARKVWSCATTAAPSPMAAPTRFTEPQRTSPTAKMPSTPVSSGSGIRSVEPTSPPVRTKPFSSRGTPQPVSQLAAGSAPVKRNRWAMACCSSAPVRLLRQRTPFRPLFGCAEELDDLGIAENRDVRCGRDSIDEVARHRAREAGPAHEHAHLTRVARQEHGRLARRVSSAHEIHVLVAAQSGLGRRGPVRDAAALELRQVRNLRSAIERAGGDHDRARPNPPAVGKLEDVHGIGARALRRAVQPRDLGRQAELGPEFLGLRERAPHQRLPRHAGRKAQVVLDARAGAGLSSERGLFQDQDREALGRTVDRRREPGRARADDRHVVRLGAEPGRHEAEGPRQLLLRRIPEYRPARQNHDRELSWLGRIAREQRRGIGVAHQDRRPGTECRCVRGSRTAASRPVT